MDEQEYMRKAWDKFLHDPRYPVEVPMEKQSLIKRYESTKCIDGHHTECVTHAGMGYGGDVCACECHALSGEAREFLTHMCESPMLRNRVLALLMKTVAREKRQAGEIGGHREDRKDTIEP